MKTFATILLLVCLSACAVLTMESCRKKDRFTPAHPLAVIQPPGFPAPFFTGALSEEGFLLGRKLFYDGRLSKDGHFPCSSCHQQIAAFTTFEHDRSHGYNHSHTLRNAPGLFNLAWQPDFRRDGSAKTMDEVSLAHMQHPQEMAEDITAILQKLQPDTAYQRMFRAAYGDDFITQGRILNALTQFMALMVSANSKYDRVKAGTAQFTAEEQSGYATFQQKCAACHKEPLFTDFSFRNVGLEVDPALSDFGRMRVTGKKGDSLKFRVPSLRNLDLTSYYTHDGRLSVFRMMLQHYRDGVNVGPTVDPLVINGIPITLTEENNLVYFLRTLTDSSFINNPRYSE
jgi:cytochrome c peroxidase